jgi:hypothetical protein
MKKYLFFNPVFNNIRVSGTVYNTVPTLVSTKLFSTNFTYCYPKRSAEELEELEEDVSTTKRTKLDTEDSEEKSTEELGTSSNANPSAESPKEESTQANPYAESPKEESAEEYTYEDPYGNYDAMDDVLKIFGLKEETPEEPTPETNPQGHQFSEID